MKLVHHHVGRVETRALAQGHVREHLRGAADDRRLRVHAGVARQHAHVLGAEELAPLEELLARQGLGGRGVEGAPALAEPLEVKRHRNQGLA